MNRVLKKAVSFLTAVVVGASAFAATVVPASAASAKLTAKQAVANSYDTVTIFDNGAFFSSKSKCVLVDNTGKKISVKNTIGFNKIYAPVTQADPAPSTEKINVVGWPYVLVGKGDKVAAILQNGKFLADGKLFNHIEECGDNIAAVSGNTTYIYSVKGKKIAEIKGGKYGEISEFDPASKVSVFEKVDSYDDWGYVDKATITILDKSGKVLAKESNVRWTSMYTVGKDKYLQVNSSPNDYMIKIYYDMKGNKLTDEQAEQIMDLYYESSDNSGESDNQAEPVNHNLTVESTWKDYNCYTLNVSDSDGTIVYTSESERPAHEGTGYMWLNGKLIIAAGNYAVIDDATGKVEHKGNFNDLDGIEYISSDQKTLIVQDTNWNSTLLTIGGKKLSKTNVSPITYGDYFDYVLADGSISSIKSYVAKDGFIFTDNGKKGIMGSNGKVIVKAKYGDIRFGDNGVALAESSGKYSIINTKGKVLAKNLYIVPRAIWLSDNLSSDKADVYITQNKAGTKFGCFVVKAK